MPDDLDQQIQQEIQKAIKAGVKIKDKERLVGWFKDKIGKGFSIVYIAKKLEDYHYDFATVDTYLNDIYQRNVQVEEAYIKVRNIEAKFQKEEKQKKQSSEIVRIFAAFLIAGVAAFTASTIGENTKDLIVEGSEMEGFGMIGSMIKTFVNVAWGVSVIAGLAGVVFLGLFIYKYRASISKLFSKLKKAPPQEAQQ